MSFLERWIRKGLQHKVVTSTVGFVVLLLVRHYIIKWYRKYKKYPPGPIGLPIIGSFLLMTKLRKLSMESPFKYGPIMYTTMGKRHFVLVNSSKVFKKIAKRQDFVNRPENIAKFTHSTVGFLFLNNSEYWSERRLDIRKSLINTVSKTDFVENNIFKLLKDNTFNVLDDCVQNNKLFYAKNYITYIAFNNLFYVSFGYSLDKNDEVYYKYSKLADEFSPRLVVGFMPFYLGFMKYVLKSFINKTMKLEHEMDKIIKEFINKMKVSSNNNDCYVSNMLDENNKTYKKLPFRSKIADIRITFIAAVNTTSSSINMTLILLCMNLDVQNEVRDELLRVFKNNENFTLKKLKLCPKLHALIYEGLRLANVAYVGAPHTILKDMNIKVENKEYLIPKNSVILSNTTFIHDNSPNENWIPVKRESKFHFNHTLKLHNFLEKDTLTNKLKFKMNESFVYFGLGKRDCVGRQLAIKQMIIIIGQLLLKYKFQLSKKDKNIKQLKFKDGFINRVEPIGLVVKPV